MLPPYHPLLTEPIANFFIPFVEYIIRNWWFWLPIFLFLLFMKFWVAYRQLIYISTRKWILLELKMPPETQRSPKAMDQFFTSLYTLRNSPGNFREEYWEGEVSMWFSLEITSFGGDIHFYIRTLKKHKNVLEANLYAQYPHMEIIEVEDYVNKIPLTIKEMYANNLNMFGSELILAEDDAYPIVTYAQFEGDKKKLDNEGEQSLIDPIASLLEILIKLKKQEHFWMQILAQPAGSDWKKRAQKVVEALKKKSEQIKVKEGGIEKTLVRVPTIGESEAIKAIEKNCAKRGYNAVIRELYVAPKDIFTRHFGEKGILSALNQYSSASLNSFKNNTSVYTRTQWVYYPYIFCKTRLETRMQRMLKKYQEREFPEETWVGKFLTGHLFASGFNSKSFVLNTEELATLFHPPTFAVLTGPLIKKAESKRMGPPIGLPLFNEEELPDELK